MSDNETLTTESDDRIRTRLQAFAWNVEDRADTEAALERLRRPTRLPTTGLMAIAAALLVVVGLAAVVITDRGVDTVDVTDSATPTTDCPRTTRPRIISLGGQMDKHFPVARVAAAILLFGACADGDTAPKLLARGNVEFVGNEGLGENTMDINAEEHDGTVTGEARFNEIVVAFECADLDAPDGVVILGGNVTAPSSDGSPAVGELMAVVIRDGDPDGVTVWFDEGASESCADMLGTIPDDVPLTLVEDGDDIETG